MSLLLVDGEPHWRQLECSIGLRSVGYCLLNFTMLSFSLFAMKRNPAGPVHSQVSKKGRGSWCREAVTSRCGDQRSLMLGEVTWVSGGPWEKWWGWGGVGESCPCRGWPQGSRFPYFVKKPSALIAIAERCWHFCCEWKQAKKQNQKRTNNKKREIIFCWVIVWISFLTTLLKPLQLAAQVLNACRKSLEEMCFNEPMVYLVLTPCISDT